MTPDAFVATRSVLHRVAVHILARARQQATGRFSLRVTPGGFGTPEFGIDARRVRIGAGHVVVESDAEGAATIVARRIDGATLAQLAAFARVSLDEPLDVGADTPPVGDVDAPLRVDTAAFAAVTAWFGTVAGLLDAIVADVTPGRQASLPRLWPEHFDLAIEIDAHPDRRVNVGGSPGDGFCDEPYVYVGPWTDDRPGDPDFWNAPFGAYLPASGLGDDPVTTARRFVLEGLDRLG